VPPTLGRKLALKLSNPRNDPVLRRVQQVTTILASMA
jgi:hypothetical protein